MSGLKCIKRIRFLCEKHEINKDCGHLKTTSIGRGKRVPKDPGNQTGRPALQFLSQAHDLHIARIAEKADASRR